MAQTRVQQTRKYNTGERPASGVAGELFVNTADLQLGVIDNYKDVQDLLAVRFYSEDSQYNIGDIVVYSGKLYECKQQTIVGKFNPTYWFKVSGDSNRNLNYKAVTDGYRIQPGDNHAFVRMEGGGSGVTTNIYLDAGIFVDGSIITIYNAANPGKLVLHGPTGLNFTDQYTPYYHGNTYTIEPHELVNFYFMDGGVEAFAEGAANVQVGPQGPQGLKGDKGDRGDQGPPGEIGKPVGDFRY